MKNWKLQFLKQWMPLEYQRLISRHVVFGGSFGLEYIEQETSDDGFYLCLGFVIIWGYK